MRCARERKAHQRGRILRADVTRVHAAEDAGSYDVTRYDVSVTCA